MTPDDRDRLRGGVRAGVPLMLPTLAIGVSFGVLAAPVLGAVPSVVMSVVVFAGGAQLAAGPLGETVGPHAQEHLLSGPQLVTCLGSPVFAPQPLTEKQASTCSHNGQRGTLQFGYRGAELLFDVLTGPGERG